jgi:SAM-dependent methyltransferase
MTVSGRQETEWYRNWFNSPYYHILYADRDEQEASDFINLLIDYLQPKAHSKMLDIACGKGRHSIQLAQKNYLVTGIDISPISIHEANLCALDNMDFYIHDMRRPFRINYYDYAFNFFTSFGYFDSVKEHQNALHNMTLALAPGGHFIMDYLNPLYTIKHLQASSEINTGNIHFHISRWADEKYIYKKIIIEDPAHQSPQTFMEKVANFDMNDFSEMFSKNRLEITTVFGDYHLNTFDPVLSPRMIMIAKKLPV